MSQRNSLVSCANENSITLIQSPYTAHKSHNYFMCILCSIFEINFTVSDCVLNKLFESPKRFYENAPSGILTTRNTFRCKNLIICYLRW